MQLGYPKVTQTNFSATGNFFDNLQYQASRLKTTSCWKLLYSILYSNVGWVVIAY